MSQYWSDIVHRLTPYVPGEQPKQKGLIKLNTNECPYGPSPAVLEAIRAEVSDDLRLYPDPEASRLKQAVADYHGLRPEQVFPGNGSDEILALTFQALLHHDEAVLFPEVSYGFYPVYCRLYQIDYRTIPLAVDFSIPVAEYRPPNGGIVLANPNAPTGLALSRADVERILMANPDSVVVLDEAYVDFGGETAVPLIDRYPNLLVVHTLSKSRALAGLRVGFAMGQRDLITALERVKNSFNSFPLDRMAINGAVAALQDQAYFEQLCDRVIATRERLNNALADLGFQVIPSSTNFVFATHPDHDAQTLHGQLRREGIIVRHFDKPGIDQYLRISIGTDSECERLVTVLQTLCGSA